MKGHGLVWITDDCRRVAGEDGLLSEDARLEMQDGGVEDEYGRGC
jgi:hypothetical protein